jgi:small-conductance mechanosensitive channel
MMSPSAAVVQPLQGSIADTIQQTIADVIAYLPSVLGVLLILLVGYIVGRVLGGLVTRVVRRLGVDRYAAGTTVEEVGGEDSIARGLGKLVAYYVYFVAVVAAADALGIPMLTGLLTELGAYLPVLLGALIVLVIGFVVGRFVGDLVSDLVGGFAIGQYFRETPLEPLGDQEGEFGRIVGTAVAYYVYLITLLAVADILNVGALSTFLDELVAYLPALVGGLLVLLVSIWVRRTRRRPRRREHRRLNGIGERVRPGGRVIRR